MDGVSVDVEFLGRFALVYEEREHYHGPGLTKFEHKVRRKGQAQRGRFQCGGTGNRLRRGLHHAQDLAGDTSVNFRRRRANVVSENIEMELQTCCSRSARRRRA